MQTSELLDAAGIRHGFSTRADGDAREVGIQERLVSSLGLEALATCTQVHGTRVIWPSAPGRSSVEADALCSRGGLTVGVLSADCVPILMVDPGAGLGAAVHAGWRGTLAGAAAAGVEALCSAGARKERLLVALGPRIQRCCYEVGEELSQDFVQRFGKGVERRNPNSFLDLGAAIQLQLEENGLKEEQIEALDLCTGCRRAADGAFLFHSYRREGPAAGRQISLLAP
jgi:polyphenol oxidase